MTIRKFFLLLYGAFFILLIALGMMSSVLNLNQEDVKRSQEVRYQSYLLASELRHSIDDLTRFARTYVVTGDSIRVIREHTQQVVAAAEQITASARQQLAGMDQINRAVQNINLGATQTQEGMQQVDKTAQNLNDLARQLTGIVQQYKTA